MGEHITADQEYNQLLWVLILILTDRALGFSGSECSILEVLRVAYVQRMPYTSVNRLTIPLFLQIQPSRGTGRWPDRRCYCGCNR